MAQIQKRKTNSNSLIGKFQPPILGERWSDLPPGTYLAIL